MLDALCVLGFPSGLARTSTSHSALWGRGAEWSWATNWPALARHLEDDAAAIDNYNLGRKAWMFVGSELAGHRAAAVMSLVQSARLHGHDPWAYLRDVLQRLPTQFDSRIEELLPHRWRASASCDSDCQ